MCGTCLLVVPQPTSVWERKQPVHRCCTIQLCQSRTDKKVDGSADGAVWNQRCICGASRLFVASSVTAAEMLTWTLFIVMWTGLAAHLVVVPCNQNMFDTNVDTCLSEFNRSMDTSDYVHSCPWPTVKRVYYRLKVCVDSWAKESWCSGVGSLVDHVFLKVHHTYFRLCGRVHDPPLTTLIMLIAPVIIATVLLPFLCINCTTCDREKPRSVGL